MMIASKNEILVDNWCVTKLKAIETKYQWTIKNLNLCKETLENLNSGIFSSAIGNEIVLKWQLKLNFKGKGENQDYLSISLCRVDSLKGIKPKVKVTFMIIDSKQQVAHKLDMVDEVVNDTGLEIPRFVKTNSSILKENQDLSILCYVKIGLNPTKVFSNKGNPSELNLDNDYSFRVIKDLDKLRGNENLSDCVLISQSKKFYVQKAILAVRSLTFRNMFKNSNNQENIQVNESTLNKYEIFYVPHSPEILNELLNFIYTGELQNIEKSTNELLKVAHEYALPGMKKLCEIYLGKQLTIDNAIVMLLLSINAEAVDLKQQVIDFMIIHAKSIVNSSAFKTIGSLPDNVRQDIMHVLIENQ